MAKCLCEEEATYRAWVPSNMWSGLQQMVESHPVCDYHADKARGLGLEVVPLPERPRAIRRHQVREWEGG
jgi:hypothetical protein